MSTDFAKGIAMWCGQGGFHVQPTPDQEGEIIAFVKKCAQHGVTRLFPALIRRDYFPRYINFDDEEAYRGPVVTMKDFYSRWDPLKVLVDAAHDEGIEAHIYMNLNNHGSRWPNWGSPLTNTVFGAPMKVGLAIMGTSKFASDHREFWKKDRLGRDSYQIAGNVRLSPTFEQVRAYEVQQILEFVDECSPDGVQLELTLEPADENGVTILGYEEPALQAFEQEYGQSPLELDNSDPRWIDFRCHYVTTFVRELCTALNQLPRPLPLTISVITAAPSDPGGYRKIFRDWPAWVQEGLIDAVHLWFREWIDLETLPQQVKDAVDLMAGRRPLIAELSTYHRGALKTAESLREGARLARAAGADAVAVYKSDPIEALNLWSVVEEIGCANP